MWRWPRQYRCHRCAKLGHERRADVRIFVGDAVGSVVAGGFPVCATHTSTEIDYHLRSLLGRPADHEVTVILVESEHDLPYLGHVLFVARAKPTALQGLPHATSTA